MQSTAFRLQPRKLQEPMRTPRYGLHTRNADGPVYFARRLTDQHQNVRMRLQVLKVTMGIQLLGLGHFILPKSFYRHSKLSATTTLTRELPFA